MNSLPLQISDKAISDIDEIWHYTVEKWSIEQANHYYDLIFKEIGNIGHNPDCGKKIDNIRKNYRVVKILAHFVFYRIRTDRVEIIRILHHRMDIGTRLRE